MGERRLSTLFNARDVLSNEANVQKQAEIAFRLLRATDRGSILNFLSFESDDEFDGANDESFFQINRTDSLNAQLEGVDRINPKR